MSPAKGGGMEIQMAKVGIDFGTSNSSVMFKMDGSMRSLLRNGDASSEPTIYFAPTEVFVRKDGSIGCGWEISDANRKRSSNELIRSFKEKLVDDSDNRLICGKDKWEYYKKFIQYLINNANKSPYLISGNDKVTEVILSYPYATSTMYTTKLKKYTEEVEVTDAKGQSYHLKVAELNEEPVAISLNYYAQNPVYSSKTVLICDIGGGTTDLSVVENIGTRKIVVAHDGLRKAGNHIDMLILEYLLQKTPMSKEKFFSASNRALEKNKYEIRLIKESIEKEKESSVELTYNGEIIYDDDFTVEDYYRIITPFVNEIVKMCKTLILNSKKKIDTIVLAGGGANCQKIESMFKSTFSDILVTSCSVDRRTATASGNAEAFYIPSSNRVKKILGYSYGIDCWDLTNNVNSIDIVLYKDEVLPILNRQVNYVTRYALDSVDYNFYIGKDNDKNKQREYSFSAYEHLANQTFTYRFNMKVPAGTLLRTYVSMDINGIMTIRVESDYGSMQTKTITDLK